jgi:hypothetical protein
MIGPFPFQAQSNTFPTSFKANAMQSSLHKPRFKCLAIWAGVTQPPWLHQFHLGWTQVHPNYWIYYRHWGWVNSFFFPSLTSRLPVKKIYYIAQTFQTQLPTSPIKNPKPCHHSKAKAMLQKMVLQKQCWTAATKDNVVVGVLKQCCKSGVEAVLQKTLLKWCCKKCSSKKTSASVASKGTSTFLNICLFFTPIFLFRCSRWQGAGEAHRHLLHLRKKKVKKWRQARAREARRHLLHLKKMQKMLTSWEAPDSLSFPGFFLNFEFTNCIAT